VNGPPDERSRPLPGGGPQNIAGGDFQTLTRRCDNFAASERRRASVRLDKLLGTRVVAADLPAHFGLSRRELELEIRRCRASGGWQLWELIARFANPAGVPVEGWDR
jgi:hypothetical protein